MYPKPAERGKAIRNRQRDVGTASLDAEGAGCDTSTAGNSPTPARGQKFPFCGQMATATKITCPPTRKKEKKKRARRTRSNL